jgi:murein endopeptidase
MSWRQDEIWLDTDLLWFREPSLGGAASLESNAPRFSRLAPRALATAIPNGLAESRRRRAELRRRHRVRKTRAAALVIGPAVMLTLAAPRLGGASRGGEALEEDPPTQTLQPGRDGSAKRSPAGSGPGHVRSGPDRGQMPRTTPFPELRLKRATSHGLPYSGWLSDGTQLPLEGPDWVTWNPVEDRVPNRPGRLYGHERTIRAILAVAAAYREANPNAPRVVVGDISFRRGGPMELHRSHQNGLDADVYYPRVDRRLRAPRTTDQVDRALAQDLVDRFVAAGARMVLVGHSTGLYGPHDVVVPYPSHEDHLHVRFRVPTD